MGTVVSLFDFSGKAVEPWVKAGHKAYIVDIQHKPGIYYNVDTNIFEVGYDLLIVNDTESFIDWMESYNHPIYGDESNVFTFAFPPCDHLSVSGARWFKGKGLHKLANSIIMFANAAEICETLGAPYMIENPVSTISTYWRKPDHIFHPHFFTGYERNDNYTKKTCIWTGGGFKMPESFIEIGLGAPDNRIHYASPGPERSKKRSTTPSGFSTAVYLANSGTHKES